MAGRLTAFGAALTVAYEAAKHWDGIKEAFSTVWNGDGMAKLSADFGHLGETAGKLGGDLDKAVQNFEKMFHLNPGKSGLIDALEGLIGVVDRVVTSVDLAAQAMHKLLNPQEAVSAELAQANASTYAMTKTRQDAFIGGLLAHDPTSLTRWSYGLSNQDVWRDSLGAKGYANEQTNRDRQDRIGDVKTVEVHNAPITGEAKVLVGGTIMIDPSRINQLIVNAQQNMKMGNASAAAPAAMNDSGGRR